jgi:hypothetical protein
MSEEVEQSEGTWSSLKKTVLGTVATVVTAGGAWLGSTLFGGGEDKAAAPAPAPVINITNSQTQQQAAGGGGKTVIIKEKEVAKPAEPAKPVKKKEGDEFKEEAPKW